MCQKNSRNNQVQNQNKSKNKGYNQNQQENSSFDQMNNFKFEDNSNARA